MKKLLRVGAGCLAALALTEAAARLALSFEAVLAEVAGVDDASYRLEWIRRHKAGTPPGYAFDAYHPTRGWALKPGIHDLEVFDGKLLNTNSRGLRGAAEHTLDKPAGITRVLVLGDSFSFGEDVGDDETFAHRLEETLPNSQVLNLGVHGYGHDQMLLYLKEAGLAYHPDVVIVGFVAIDMERNMLTFRDYAKPRFVLEDGRLVARNVPVAAPEETLAAEPYRSKLMDLLAMLDQRRRLATGARDREMIALSIAIFDEMTAAIRARGATPVFAYLPVIGEIVRPSLELSPPERFFLSYCQERGVLSVFLRPLFLRKLEEGAELKGYGHWGPLEHRIAAEGIRDELIAKRALACAGACR